MSLGTIILIILIIALLGGFSGIGGGPFYGTGYYGGGGLGLVIIILIILLLMAYRKVVSPLYGQVCRFFPSCSAYALESVTVHGAVKGTWLAVRRLLRCHPWNSGGVDHVPAGHREWPAGHTPRIVVLNNPDKYLAAQSDGEGRPAA